MWRKLVLVASLCLIFHQQTESFVLKNENVTLNLDLSETDGILISLTLDEIYKISGRIGEGNNVVKPTTDCDGASSCYLKSDDGSINLNITSVHSGFSITWQSENIQNVFKDCLDLEQDHVHWFGGPELLTSEWPIQNLRLKELAYRSSRLENGAVIESYWLNSKGGYIFVDESVPLFLDQNNIKDDSICLIAKIQEPYINRNQSLLKYVLVANENAKEAQIHAIKNYLGKPIGRPNDRLIRKPIWTTWAKYKKEINDQIVLDFARDIINHNYTGQLEIDDSWETCYGSAIFDDKHFGNINSTVKSLKDLGFTVTIWTHPFVNDECKETTQFGRENGYFVQSRNGSDDTTWWDGDITHHIDFTKEEARQWFIERLKLIQSKHGIDSFKFDAGENDWAPMNSVLTGDMDLAPNLLTSKYVRTCATFGDLVEVRSAWRSQDLPIFVRMLDKDSRWGLNNGLHNLITTLLQMNVDGYGLVLPDMIGGNGYGSDLPTPELLVRWTQANVFMPSMQFSYLPWELTSEDFDTAAIVKKFVDLHEEFADEILRALDNCVANGTPVNAPIWWLDPTDPNALKVNDEFLLGEKILVAPIIKEDAIRRDVYLPTGRWKDGNSNSTFEGPIWIENYKAPIDILPFFIRLDSR